MERRIIKESKNSLNDNSITDLINSLNDLEINGSTYNDKENLKEESDENNNIIIEQNNDIDSHSEISKKNHSNNQNQLKAQKMNMKILIHKNFRR